MKRLVSAFATALLLCGCATVRYSNEGGRHMVDIVNTGWYMLHLIPIASGNPDAPNECSCKMFRQTTTLKNNVRLLDYAVTERNAVDVRSVRSYWTNESFLFILFQRHACHTSAELILADDGGDDVAAPTTTGASDNENPICESQNQ